MVSAWMQVLVGLSPLVLYQVRLVRDQLYNHTLLQSIAVDFIVALRCEHSLDIILCIAEDDSVSFYCLTVGLLHRLDLNALHNWLLDPSWGVLKDGLKTAHVDGVHRRLLICFRHVCNFTQNSKKVKTIV